MKKNQPYIGITGFTNQDDVWRCLEHVPEQSERLFMVGALLSSKTISGGTNKYPVRYPHYNQIKNIFTNDIRCLNMIHYVTDDKATLKQQLLDAAEIGGEHCQGFQLNMAWPEIQVLEEIRKELPNHKFVIQCGSHAVHIFNIFKDVTNDDSLAKMLLEYVQQYQNKNVIDYLLIDPSGGRGKSFDANHTNVLMKPHLTQSYTFGVAGGLNASTISNLIPVLKNNPYLFWDAEGGLRDENDNFVLKSAQDYLDQSFGLIELLNAKAKYNEYITNN